ncbi:pyrrolysine--tRNA(Pyl) ligase small subunit [Eubacteriaceae bacterium ES2]|nr:pyrrolysine--tRNA(Pyl) ligase small subunit [Eubacteriaceae bacterium ES2]
MSSINETSEKTKQPAKRYINKNQSLYSLIRTIKLWPSRTGVLHGLKTVEKKGQTIHVVTHCGEEFDVWDSKNSRSARWLRNRWCTRPCPKCNVPDWKISKYSATVFSSNVK